MPTWPFSVLDISRQLSSALLRHLTKSEPLPCQDTMGLSTMQLLVGKNMSKKSVVVLFPTRTLMKKPRTQCCNLRKTSSMLKYAWHEHLSRDLTESKTQHQNSYHN